MRQLRSSSKAAGAIITFIVLTFIFISGISLFVMYQSLVVESQIILQERQNEFIQASQTQFEIENATYDESLEIVSFIITNTGSADIDTTKLEYFVNDEFGVNSSISLLDNISKTTQLLRPNSKMRVEFTRSIPQDTLTTLKVVHDFGIRAFTDIEL